MKNNQIITILGTSIIAAALTANAKYEKNQNSTANSIGKGKKIRIQIGNINLLDELFYESTVKDRTEDLNTMLDGSKTEIAEKTEK